tara:strand:- start:827 stop:1411 length:585 start_codon:yes stop_codon:yes gene_type:complete
MSSVYRQRLEEWLSKQNIKSEWLLDIGGSQQSLPKRVNSWQVKHYLIADLPNPHEKNNDVDIEFDLNRYGKMQQGLIEYKGMFDTVFCLEVFEYIYNPVFAMQSLCDFVKPGGKVIISAPFYYPIHEPVENDYLRYTEAGLIKIASEVGLTHKITHNRLAQTNALQQVISAEKLKASKNYTEHNNLGYIMEFIK